MIQLYIHVKFSSTREIIAENEHVPLGMIGVSSGTVRHLGKFQCRAPVLRRDGSSNVLQTRFMLGLEDVDWCSLMLTDVDWEAQNEAQNKNNKIGP